MTSCRAAAVVSAAAIALAACAPARPAYSGTVTTESVSVGSETGGRVTAIFVATGSRVRRGQVLLHLDAAQLQAQEQQAAAAVLEARERLAEAVSGNRASDVERARAGSAGAQAAYQQALDQSPPQTAAAAAAIRDAESAATLARIDLGRTRSLAASGDVSRANLDAARAADTSARARVAQARADYAALVHAQLPGERSTTGANATAQQAAYETMRSGSRTEEIGQDRASLAAAQAAERYAAARLAETAVFAPADGVVESFNLHPGDLLAAGQVAAIIDTFADPYVYVYTSQRDLGGLVRGRALRVTSDVDGAVYDGVVEANDRSAQFTPQNVETADQRAELVYGVKVRIRDPRHALLAGTTVEVRAP
jgi:HlyD family secretion protein